MSSIRTPFFLLALGLIAIVFLIELGILGDPPGTAIKYLALPDAVALFTIGLIGLGLIVPANMLAKAQGIATLVFSVVLIITGVIAVYVAFGLIFLLRSIDRSAALAVLSLFMVLKIGFAACLFAAQQRFLQNLGLVLIVATSLLGNLVIVFMYGLVPDFLTSAADAIAAVVVAVIAIAWAVFLLIGSIPAILAIIRVSPPKLSS